jgi:hypothetical protein
MRSPWIEPYVVSVVPKTETTNTISIFTLIQGYL